MTWFLIGFTTTLLVLVGVDTYLRSKKGVTL